MTITTLNNQNRLHLSEEYVEQANRAKAEKSSDDKDDSLFQQMAFPDASNITPLPQPINDTPQAAPVPLVDTSFFVNLTNATQEATKTAANAIHFECKMLVPSMGEVKISLNDHAGKLSISLDFKQKAALETAKKHQETLTNHLSDSLEKPVRLQLSLMEGHLDEATL